MANVTVTLRHSDVWPVGTTVEAFPSSALPRSGRGSQKPAGSSIASGVVDAAGAVALTFPAKSGGFVAWAQVSGVHRTVDIGDPTSSASPDVGTLRSRVQRRRALVGV